MLTGGGVRRCLVVIVVIPDTSFRTGGDYSVNLCRSRLHTFLVADRLATPCGDTGGPTRLGLSELGARNRGAVFSVGLRCGVVGVGPGTGGTVDLTRRRGNSSAGLISLYRENRKYHGYRDQMADVRVICGLPWATPRRN